MIVLRFRHGSTTSEWQFSGMDEPALRTMLADLGVYAADLGVYAAEPDSDEAVLTAADESGSPLGAWTRAGAAHLASLMSRERTTSPWAEVEAAIQSEVMDPHPADA